jgi:hypothetical protein
MAILPSPSGLKRSYSTFASDLRPSSAHANSNSNAIANANSDETDTSRATELALREVLDSLRAATKNATPKPSPFKFDVQAQTFPSLCLKLLPTPATLFQTSPFPTPQSIPISPPGHDQLIPLRNTMTKTIDYWKWHTLRLAQPTTSNIAEEADFLSRSAAQWTESALAHLDSSFQNWMTHPPDMRTLLWQVELLRSYKSEQDRVQELEEKVETLQQETNQLQQQVEHLSRCQWPREMALWPPERKTFGATMRDQLRLIDLYKVPGGLGGQNGEAAAFPGERVAAGSLPGENIYTRGDKWDFDRLVNKWAAHIKEDRNRRLPQPQSQAQAQPQQHQQPQPGAQGHAHGQGQGQAQSHSLPQPQQPQPVSRDGTPRMAELRKSYTEPVSTNGITNANGQSPLINPSNNEERRRKRQMGNISIISDY